MGNFYKHNKKTQTGLNQKSAETFKLTNSLWKANYDQKTQKNKCFKYFGLLSI